MKVSKRLALGAAAVAAIGVAIPVLADPGHPQGGTGQTKCVDTNGKNLDGNVTWSPKTIWPPILVRVQPLAAKFVSSCK